MITSKHLDMPDVTAGITKHIGPSGKSPLKKMSDERPIPLLVNPNAK